MMQAVRDLFWDTLVRRDRSLDLINSLNDENKAAILEQLNHSSVKKWIDENIDIKRIANLRVSFPDAVTSITCMGFACQANDVSTVCQLLAAGADTSVTRSDGATLLHLACSSTKDAREKVQRLLDANPALVNSRNDNNSTPLHVTSTVGKVDVMDVLLDHGADVNAQGGPYGRTALHNVAALGNVGCIHALMKRGADVNSRDVERGVMALHLAATFKHNDCMKVLINDYGASVNATEDLTKNIALHSAATVGNLDGINILTSHTQCDIEARNLNNKTPLHVACEKGFVDCSRVLLQRGADVDAVAVNNWTALQLATYYKHDKCAKMLIEEFDAAINSAADNGYTALHTAAWQGSFGMVKILAAYYDCDVSIKDAYGRTAAALARAYKHDEIAQFLEKKRYGKCDPHLLQVNLNFFNGDKITLVFYRIFARFDMRLPPAFAVNRNF